jgi:hypothetical protein
MAHVDDRPGRGPSCVHVYLRGDQVLRRGLPRKSVEG